MTADRMKGIPRNKGDIVAIIIASYPDSPICHNGKYQTVTPRDVRIDQKTKPL